jgi:tRNA pseudouridine55 synthase
LQTKRIKRDVSGVLLLDKPVGITSNAALQHAKRLYRASKAGLTGILDPLASGLLPLCFGEATKFAQYPTDADKSYEVVIKLGITTDTGDSEGQVLTRQASTAGRADVERAIKQFTGTILQTPPMYSALKHQGQPLYKYARQGIEIERAPREITIHRITLMEFAGDTFNLSVDCSKGTYIRVLAEDIGSFLGCGAHLIALRRTRVGNFSLADAYSLDVIEALSETERDLRLLPADRLVESLPGVDLDQDAAYYLRQGQAVWQPKLQFQQRYRIYDEKHVFMGVGEVDDAGRLAPKRLVVQR